MDTYTGNITLTIPAHGSTTWETAVDNNYVIIDAAIAANASNIASEASRAKSVEVTKANIASLANVAFTGSYNSLSNTPMLNYDAAGSAAAVQANVTAEITRAETVEALKANIASLANVAFTGSYTSLSNVPTLVFDAVGSANTVQANLTLEVSRAENAEANIANIITLLTASVSSKANISVLANVAFTGSYNDITNKPTFGNAAYANTTAFDTAGSAANVQANLTNAVANLVPKTLTINGQALTSNITLAIPTAIEFSDNDSI